MKLTPLLTIACAWQLAAARADFTIVQKVDGMAQQSGNITIKIKDAKARADVAPQISNLIDGTSGDMFTLMHAQKTFMKIPAAQTKVLMEQMQKMQGFGREGAPPVAKPVASGQKEKVEQWDAEIYTWAGGAMSARYWVAKDFPNAAAIQAAMEKVQSGGLAALAKGLMPANSDFPGMVVRTEVKMGAKTITTTVTSVKEEPLDAKEFETPADYKEVPTPAFNFPAPATP